jgi:signal transduction histidine kinase
VNKRLFAQLLLISLSVSFILEAVIITSIRTLNEAGEGPIRNPALKFMARIMERGGDHQTTIHNLEAMRTRLGLRIIPVWIVGEHGRVKAATPPFLTLPLRWETLTKPRKIHGIAAHYPPFRLAPDYMIIRLDSPSPTYLLVGISTTGTLQRVLLEQAVFLFSTMAASAFAGLLITFVYLRQKSRQAKEVLGRLEKGDLKARFPLSRLDEAGSLMTDFNRMAEAIEQLVSRIESTDRSRQELLQELGHDLRTPVTSLKAAVDTLASHGERMSQEEQSRFVDILRTESRYFLRMIDDLFFIAEMENPKYRKTAEEIDLVLLLASEIQDREEPGSPGDRPVSCILDAKETSITLTGNPILLKRLFRNALQNARRYALSRVQVTVGTLNKNEGQDFLVVRIEDDGPGITPEEAALFGKRRGRRFSSSQNPSNSEISLGLGSVIMDAIVRLHGGTLAITNLSASGRSGTELTVEIPL